MTDQSYSGSYGNGQAGGFSYGSSGGGYGGNGGYSSTSYSADTSGLRHRGATAPSFAFNEGGYDKTKKSKKVVEKLDFMFPKVNKEFTVKTKGGGVVSLVASSLIAVLILAEIITWFAQNRMEVSKTYVDNSLGKKMRVNMNITFPALSCDDLHLDVIDIAGDSHIDVEDTLVKKRYHLDGRPLTKQEIEVETNQHRQQQVEKERILKSQLPDDYCGPCYGAHELEEDCCQTCDELIAAYNKKRWKTEFLMFTAEQCVREGRDKVEPKRMVKNQGCNLSGYMSLNRVSGNFHIAMGEGVERDGRHIHTFLPEDAPNFNASHIIHQLSFGPEDGSEPLSGTTKIVTEDSGTTGLFQYFIKIVPTTYVGENIFPKLKSGEDSLPSLYDEFEQSVSKVGSRKSIETNRYFITERFMPLMTDLLEEEHKEDDDNFDRHAVHAGHSGGHGNHEHHMIQNSVLPGVFFIYEIYPFAVEISRNEVPFTHLLIRILATIGGVFTLAKWADSYIYERKATRRKN